MNKVKIWKQARKQIRKLSKWNCEFKRKIQYWIDFLKESKIPNPPKIAKLKWSLSKFYKLKMPPFRFIIAIENHNVLIDSVLLRKNAYKNN